jgi:hypothetical protein
MSDRSAKAFGGGERRPPYTAANLACSFCGKCRDQVRNMVAGPTWHVAICDECVGLCSEIFAEGLEEPRG